MLQIIVIGIQSKYKIASLLKKSLQMKSVTSFLFPALTKKHPSSFNSGNSCARERERTKDNKKYIIYSYEWTICVWVTFAINDKDQPYN
jgi:hypothetical protein